MDQTAKKNSAHDSKEDLLRCPVCDVYLKKSDGFRCPQCKRSPLCKKHRVPGKRECETCVIDMQHDELNNLRKQDASITNFIRLLQFLFLVFSIFFISTKIGLEDIVVFLQNNLIVNSLMFLLGGIIVGYMMVFVIRSIQRKKIRELENKLDILKIRKRV